MNASYTKEGNKESFDNLDEDIENHLETIN